MIMESISDENKQLVIHDLERQVELSLRLLDPELVKEYQQAVKEVPDLVSLESPVVNFLRTEDWHTLRAAKRIALYWKLRKEIFGDRFLLPMNQTGAGALTPAQVEILRSGFIVLTTTPQPVCICDCSRLPPGVDEVDPAILFYLNTFACERAQTEGYTIFHVIRSGWSPTIKRISPEATHRIISSQAFKIKNVIIVRSFEPDREYLLDYLVHQDERASEARLQHKPEFVMGHSVRNTVDLLEERGLDRGCVPFVVGGDYFYSQFDGWIRSRLSVENAMMAAPPIRNSCTANAMAKCARSILAAATQQQVSPLASAAAATTTTTAAAAVVTSSQDNSDASSDTGREGTLVKRRPGESRQAFEKRRHLVYGKRSYDKRRAGQLQLQKKRDFLERSIEKLRMDNRRLETLMVQARLLIAKYMEECSATRGPTLPIIEMVED